MTDKELIDAWLSGEADGAMRDRLRKLACDGTLREQARIHHALAALLGNGAADRRLMESVMAELAAQAPDAVHRDVMLKLRRQPSVIRAKTRFVPLALAAALTIGLGLFLFRTHRATGPTGARIVARVESSIGGTGVLFAQDGSVRQRWALKVGDDVREGMRIETGEDGSATLAWTTEATTVDLAGNSKLETQNSKLAVLQQGRLAAVVAPQPPEQPFAVETSRARATVVGTRFEMEAQPSLTELTVRDGAVLLASLINGDSARVEAGQYARVVPGAPIQPMPIGSPMPMNYHWDFRKESPDPDIFKVFDGAWHPVTNTAGETLAMQAEGKVMAHGRGFLVLLDIPVEHLPAMVSFTLISAYDRTRQREQKTFGGHIVYDRCRSSAVLTGLQDNLGLPIRLRFYITEDAIDEWYNDRRSSVRFYEGAAGSRLVLAIRETMRIESLRMQSVPPKSVPDLSELRAAVQSVPEELRRPDPARPVPLPDLKTDSPKGARVFFNPGTKLSPFKY